MKHLPLFFDVQQRPCLVVGGGSIAARKVEALLRAGAKITVVSPSLGPQLNTHLSAGEITHLASSFEAGHLNDCVLVVAATDDEAINKQISDLAHKRNIPVNVVDRPELCSFIFPSVIDRSPVTVAVSTAGTAPVMARLLRARLETLIPSRYGRLATLAARYRNIVKARLAKGAERRRFWEDILQGPIAELVYSGKEEEAAHALQNALDKTDSAKLRRGEIYLVGAGPGDPDLLTFRALRLMQQCDVVLYDRLVPPAILDLVRREAERIYVGKRRDFHSLRQNEINALLTKLAKEGKRVLRLKGGDPFIFGRGGEEIATLSEQGIPFQVVPGITAANGCAAYAGIPLTHRDFAQSVLFVTGHLKDGSMDLNWPALVQASQTLVVYMGLVGLDILCRELIAHGMSAAMPAALVEQGTTDTQRVLIGTLESLPSIVASQNVHAPTLLIIGEIVTLHGTLAWFGK
jgi:uroporphyrin-III C-methyltransferase / precorrin-2 dehydrogenase / sirohydrochlorin ferrochelatase